MPPGLGMDDKTIKLTMHAVERGLDNNLDQEDIIRIVREGVKEQEGKTKCRIILKPRE